MKRFGWCMWQIMHCAVGIAFVITWRSGCAVSFFGMVGSTLALMPRLPNLA